MGKRSDFERIPRDFYPTPMAAVTPLVPHLPPSSTFIEPCAGDGSLISHLESFSMVTLDAFDIEPQADHIKRGDALTSSRLSETSVEWCDYIITNPPWNRKLLHPMIEHFSAIKPTWLLFDADWMHTKQSIPFMPYLRKIVSVGRVKWIPDSKMTGKDNCAWHLFDQTGRFEGQAMFFERTQS